MVRGDLKLSVDLIQTFRHLEFDLKSTVAVPIN